MKKVIKFSAIAACVFAMSSCSVCSTRVGMASLYTNVSTGEAVTSNELGNKVGESSATNLFGLLATGDASIQKAATKAGISEISHVDSKTTNFLGLFTKFTTLVYGK